MIKNLIICCLLVWVTSCKKDERKNREPTVATTSFDKAALDAQLDSIYDLGYFNGMGVAIVDKTGSIYERGLGLADVQSKTAYTANTYQNIASISKVVLGLTLAKAIEDGHLKLVDDVNDYLPFKVNSPPFANTPIQIKHLVNHTSGISDADYYDKSYVIQEEDIVNDSLIDQEELVNFQPITNAITLRKYLEYGLSITDSLDQDYIYNNHKPGTIHEYSNIAAGLTALVVENAVGEDFKTYSKREIIDALGLESTSWNLSDLDPSRRSKVYSTKELRYPDYKLVTYVDGGLYTSVHDLGILCSELIAAYNKEGTLLNDGTYQLFFEKSLDAAHLSNDDNVKNLKNNQNHGIFISYEQGRIGHTGGDPGVATVMFFKPENDFGIIYFVNTDINSQEGIQTFVNLTTLLESSQESK